LFCTADPVFPFLRLLEALVGVLNSDCRKGEAEDKGVVGNNDKGGGRAGAATTTAAPEPVGAVVGNAATLVVVF